MFKARETWSFSLSSSTLNDPVWQLNVLPLWCQMHLHRKKHQRCQILMLLICCWTLRCLKKPKWFCLLSFFLIPQSFQLINAHSHHIFPRVNLLFIFPCFEWNGNPTTSCNYHFLFSPILSPSFLIFPIPMGWNSRNVTSTCHEGTRPNTSQQNTSVLSRQWQQWLYGKKKSDGPQEWL